MSQSLAKILVHVVFSTKDRRPFLRDPLLREELHHYLGGILNQLGCQPVIAGGVADHVHILCALSRTVTAAEMGILVMGTLHTNGAAATVDRLVSAFPSDKQPHVRTMLSTSLRRSR